MDVITTPTRKVGLMADSSQTTSQEQQYQQGEDRSQTAFDSSFFEQMGAPAGASPSSLGYDITTQVVQSYFDQIESTTRQARRMADLWAQSLILQQTTSQIARAVAPVVAKQVVEHLKQNPTWARELLRNQK